MSQMFDITELAQDPDLASEGTWVDYIGGTGLKIAKDTNEDAESLRMQRIMENADVFQNLENGDEKQREEAERIADEIDIEVTAKHILKDWSGFGEGGKPLKYTPEVGIRFLSNKQFAEFRDHVAKISRNRSHYKPEAVERATQVVKSQADS